jgi:hypothetical protein
LKDAQIDGYFKSIEFHPVREYNLELADQVVAEKAVELLRGDREQGPNCLGRNEPSPLVSVYTSKPPSTTRQ